MTNNQSQIRVAIVGMGNVGKGALDAVETAPDMQLAGLVVRPHALYGQQQAYPGYPVTCDINQLGQVDVAVLAVPSRSVAEVAIPLLEQGISTVDSFDIHGQPLWKLRHDLGQVATRSGARAISAAGWDPGTDSLIRAVMTMQAPRGISHTNFGPGMSMGHSVAARKIPGVNNALSVTLPKGLGQHKRVVYVELSENAELAAVRQAIQQDAYFSHDETEVHAVSSVAELFDTGHGVLLERRGTAGRTANQHFQYQIRVTNPAVTSQVMISAARAAFRMPAGAYTLLEVPLAHFLAGELEQIIEQMV